MTQNMDALQLANRTRIQQHAFRRDVHTLTYAEGCQTVAAILVGDVENDAVERMTVGRLLLSIRRFGPRLMDAALEGAGVGSEEKRVRELTNRQRVALADWIDPGDVQQAAA